MRLIDADAFEVVTAKGVSMDFADGMQYLLEMIDKATTVEAVPLSEVYRLIAGHSNYHGDNILSALTCVAAGKKVNPIKPIEAEPVRHGEWVPVDGIDPCDEWECTACEERMTFMYELEADDMKVDFRYCPTCGAKMDGKEEEQNE